MTPGKERAAQAAPKATAGAQPGPAGGGPQRAAGGGKIPPAPRPLGPWNWLFAAGLVVAVFLVYQPAWQGGFVWDDDNHVTPPELRSGHGLYRIWFDIGATPQYYPLVCSAFWVEHKLWDDATLGYHLVNISLHAMAALTLALILRRLAVPGACLAAAIFALHPVCVESVAWITELKNTLSGVFYLAAMLLYVHFDQTRKPGWYLGALGLFVLALLSKTATVMLPAVLPVIFWWQRGRLSWKRDLLPLAPFFLVGAVAAMVTVWVERTVAGGGGKEYDLPWVERCLVAGRVICFYLGKLFWPADLIFVYPRWQVSQGDVVAVPLSPAAALLLLAVAWRLRRRWRGPLAAAAVLRHNLVPAAGLRQSFHFFRFSFVADHFQYLASLGIIALFSAGGATLLDRARAWGRVIVQAGCVALLTALAVLTWRQSRHFSDGETLYKTTIERNPACWMAHNSLGVALAARGQVDQAIDHYRKALEIKPDDVNAHYNLGNALAGRGQFDEAIDHYRKALQIEPNDIDGAQQPRRGLGRRGTARQGHRPLSQGPRTQARRREDPYQPWAWSWPPRGRPTRPSPSTARP